MEDASLTLTLFHDGQFYVGIFERRKGKQLSACRVVFGAEPKDGEIMDFLNRDFRRLSFSPKVKEERKPLPVNPKRLQREIARQVSSIGTGTKSQQALQLQREQNKAVRQEKSRQQREEERRAAYQLRQEKKKKSAAGIDPRRSRQRRYQKWKRFRITPPSASMNSTESKCVRAP